VAVVRDSGEPRHAALVVVAHLAASSRQHERNAPHACRATRGKLAARLASSGNTQDSISFTNWLRTLGSSNRLVLLAAFGEKAGTAAPQFAATAPREDIMLATNSGASERVREAAIRLASLRNDVALIDFVSLLDRNQPERLQFTVAKAMVESSGADLSKVVFTNWQRCAKAVRQRILAAAARRTVSAGAMLDAIERGDVPLVEVDTTVRQALQKSADANVMERATKLFASSVSPDREAVVQKYRAALKLTGDRVRGASLFEKNCTVCHQMQGVGAKVGPDLSGIGQQPRETLLLQILDPSRAVLPDFVAYNAETKSGDSYTGFIAGESATSVTLRRANEPDITLQRSELKTFTTSGKSLMPDGLEAALNVQDMADVIEFLRRPDRTLFSQGR
jgi:putative heme-binding domain-containing protein